MWFGATFVLQTFSYLASLNVKTHAPYAHLGVVGDRRGWPWVLGWFHTCLYVIWSNFCFTNIVVSYLFLGQNLRGPYALVGVVSDRRGWPAWPNMVPVIIIWHLDQFLFSKHCSKVLYLEIVVKFSSQEHRHPPRIQEEKSGFDSRIPKSGCDLIYKCLLDFYLTSREPREGPPTWLRNPLLEGKIPKI